MPSDSTRDPKSAAGGEANHVRAARHLACRRHRVGARRIHEHDPYAVTGSAYPTTSTRLVDPAFAIAPNDFPNIVVSPPALFPGEGLAFFSAPSRFV
jgi:hypothetical protein